MYKMRVFLIVLLITASTALFAQSGGNSSPSVKGQEQPAPKVTEEIKSTTVTHKNKTSKHSENDSNLKKSEEVKYTEPTTQQQKSTDSEIAIKGNSAVQTAQPTAQPQNNTITIDRQTYETALKANELACKTHKETIGFLKWLLLFVTGSALIGFIIFLVKLAGYNKTLKEYKDEIQKFSLELQGAESELISTHANYEILCDKIQPKIQELKQLDVILDEYKDVKRKIKSEVAIGTAKINNSIDTVKSMHNDFENKNEQALEDLRLIIKNIAVEYFQIGLVQFENEDYDKAINSFDRVIKNDSKNIAAIKYLFRATKHATSLENAYSVLKTHVGRNSDNHELLHFAALTSLDLYDKTPKYSLLDDTIEFSRKAISNFKDNTLISLRYYLYILAKAYAHKNEQKLALIEIESTLEEYPHLLYNFERDSAFSEIIKTPEYKKLHDKYIEAAKNEQKIFDMIEKAGS